MTKKVRATRKACKSIDTELSKDFIDRALNSNPKEILTNELLKMEFLFGDESIPEFEAYNSTYSTDLLKKIVQSKEIRGKNYYSRIKRIYMIFALREDIDPSERLLYTISSEYKKYINKVIKYYPELKDFDRIVELYDKGRFTDLANSPYALSSNYYGAISSMFSPSRLKKNSQANYSYILDFYSKITKDNSELYVAFKKYIEMTGEHQYGFVQLWKVIDRIIPELVKDSKAPEVVSEFYKLLCSSKSANNQRLARTFTSKLFVAYRDLANSRLELSNWNEHEAQRVISTESALKLIAIFTEFFADNSTTSEYFLDWLIHAETIRYNRAAFTSAIKLYVDNQWGSEFKKNCPSFKEKLDHLTHFGSGSRMKWIVQNSSGYFNRSFNILLDQENKSP